VETKSEAMIEDLYHAPDDGGTYELVDRRLVHNRKSFSPDASYTFQLPENRMRFVEGAPIFAVEVRSENDYGPNADTDYAAKRRDYFAAGTVVVWDVDTRARIVISYRAADPGTRKAFRAGDTADAEPALPGWRVAVDELFR